MNLEQILGRAQEIEVAIINMTAQLNALHGHKAEMAHWIQKLQSPAPDANETQVESPVEAVVEQRLLMACTYFKWIVLQIRRASHFPNTIRK